MANGSSQGEEGSLWWPIPKAGEVTTSSAGDACLTPVHWPSEEGLGGLSENSEAHILT